MQWIALGYGFALGAAQFLVIRAVCRRAFAKTDPGSAVPLMLAMAGYVLAAGAAVYLFGEQLLYAGGGLLAGLVLAAAVWFFGKIRQLKD